ncbi:clostripain-related cysteine peptidase [Hallella seregens]|uniref:clostripain-related cysteine peptidase n=1 Tax=Hallella seregens TaxID=52229 RepID=UPI0004883932|nr:clostripain-related cysteine peptidase [Hallella seregens]
MKKSFLGLVVLVLSLVGAQLFSACDNKEAPSVNDINKQTILVFMPWSGTAASSGLYPVFRQNLDSIEGAILKAKRLQGRLMVFISTAARQSELYEVGYTGGKIVHTPIKTYAGNDYTTAAGITQILNDVKANAPALNYAMMVGCHGCGWTYKADWENYPFQAKRNVLVPGQKQEAAAGAKGMGGGAAWPTTRFFGSVGDKAYGIDVPTLADGIRGAGLKMQYILFDDCYMANVETAYELRQATNYLIASTSEVLALGVPYQTMWSALASATPNYKTAVSAFHTFYSTYAYPYGALSAIDCRKVDGLAAMMRQINQRYVLADSLVDSLQVLDGFNTPLFYDLGDYADHLCPNTTLLSDFHSRLDEVVKAKAATDTLYSYLYAAPLYIKVKSYSGLTVSDPSRHPVALKGREKTGWWKATH